MSPSSRWRRLRGETQTTMDPPTIRYYEEHAEAVAERHDSIASPVAKYFGPAFPRGARVLDVGAGVGRDLSALVREGYEAYGVEPTDGLRRCAVERHPELDRRLRAGMLPAELPSTESLGGAFDGILCSAVLQHLPRAQLFDCAFAFRTLLVERGRVLVSIPLGRSVGDDARDPTGRLFNGVTAEELELLFERLGFVSIGRWSDADGLGRAGHSWATLLFELRHSQASRPIDLIEAVLSTSERKVATYKLALIRALCDVALTQPHRARFREGRKVEVPIAAVAERWVLYYWPLFDSETFLPQKGGDWNQRSHGLAFARELDALIQFYRATGGMSAFAVDRRDGAMPAHAQSLYGALTAKLKNTIHAGPVTYAGGSLDDRLFGYERGMILVESALWRELSLMGHWIQDALLLRWADLVHQLSKKDVRKDVVIARLLTVPTVERETAAARQVFATRSDVECVWTGRLLKPGSMAIDHVLPYSLWRNNDLWNLLPSHSQVNGQKSDKLPMREVLVKRRDYVLWCWTQSREGFPRRFDAEAKAQVGEPRLSLPRLFDVMAEAIEVTALQRGVQRWAP